MRQNLASLDNFVEARNLPNHTRLSDAHLILSECYSAHFHGRGLQPADHIWLSSDFVWTAIFHWVDATFRFNWLTVRRIFDIKISVRIHCWLLQIWTEITGILESFFFFFFQRFINIFDHHITRNLLWNHQLILKKKNAII